MCMAHSNCGKRIKLIFSDLNSRINKYHIPEIFSVVNVNSILSLNQMKKSINKQQF